MFYVLPHFNEGIFLSAKSTSLYQKLVYSGVGLQSLKMCN